MRDQIEPNRSLKRESAGIAFKRMNPLSDARRGYSRSTRPRHNLKNHKGDRAIDVNQPPPPPHHQPQQITKDRGAKFKDSQDQKKLQHAKDIWFRKSNIGYHCFIEYYCQQGDPSFFGRMKEQDEKYINDDDTAGTTISAATTDNTSSNSMHSSIGNSRAAKRRRKKHRTIPHPNTTTIDDSAVDTVDDNHHGIHNTPLSSSSAAAKRPHHTHTDNSDPSHLLIQALQEHSSIRTNDSARSFFTTLAQPLPITFRIRRSCAVEQKEELMQYIELFNNSRNGKDSFYRSSTC